MDPEPLRSDSSPAHPVKSTFGFRLARVFVTCGGIGYVKKGGGTLASLVATPFWWTLLHFGISRILFSALIILLFIIGIWATRLFESELGVEDSSLVVIDEWVGMGISLALVESSLILAAVAFVLFRIFDIWKPLGIRYFDKNYFEGWGVMLDDVLAGIYVNVVIGVYLLWIQPLVFPS